MPGTAWPWRWRCREPLRHLELLAQRHSCTSPKICIFIVRLVHVDCFVLELQFCLLCKIHVLPSISCELHVLSCHAEKFVYEVWLSLCKQRAFLSPITAQQVASSVTLHHWCCCLMIENTVCLSSLIDAVFLVTIWDCERSEINWCVSFRPVGFCITLVK